MASKPRKRVKRRKPRLPRVSLPRQTEKIHEKKSKDRKEKHKQSLVPDRGTE